MRVWCVGGPEGGWGCRAARVNSRSGARLRARPGWGARAIAALCARTLFVLGVLGVVVAGCAEVSPEPLSAAAHAGELENRTLDDPRLHVFVHPRLAGEAAPRHRI